MFHTGKRLCIASVCGAVVGDICGNSLSCALRPGLDVNNRNKRASISCCLHGTALGVLTKLHGLELC